MDRSTLLALLEIREGQTARVEALSEKTQVSLPLLERNLKRICQNGFVTIQGRELRVTSSQRLNLLLTSLQMGIDVEEVCKAAGWQEFEQLVEMVLQEEKYVTCRHFRFAHVGRRHEVDVVAIRKPVLLSVECKRWKKSWQYSGIREIIVSHLLRTQSLSEILSEHREKLSLRNWRTVEVLPIILMLGETPISVEKGVPIIPIHRFRDFLVEFEGHLSEFSTFCCQL